MTNDRSMSAARRKCIFVLGMHRSGTSAMAGLLAHLGFPLGNELMAANEFNKKGYFENNRIYGFNEKLLGFLDVGWDETFLLDENWIENKDLRKFREELVKMIDEDFSDTPIFAIKDPRICVLLPLYQEVFHLINIDSQYIMMVRHPEEIRLSLQRREKFSEHQSYLLWLDHILRAEYYSRDKERIFIQYDDLLENSLDVINRIKLKFGFDAKIEELIKDSAESFIEPTLRHYEIDPGNFEIPDESGQDLFNLLSTLCVDPNLTPAQQKLLDHIRQRHNFLIQNYREILVKIEVEIARQKKWIEENKLLIQCLQEKQERGEAEKAQLLHDIEEERLLRLELEHQYAGEKSDREHQISDLQRTLEESREAEDETRKELERLQILNRDQEERLKNLETDLKDIRHSLTHRLGALLTFPFHWAYRQIAGDRKVNETKFWLLANLVAQGIYNPKSLWRNLDFSKLRVLYKALQQEDNANILGNFQKLLNGVEAVNGTPDVEEEDKAWNQSENIRSSRVQILYVSPNLPDFDTSSGGKRATEMLRILAEAYDVYCFTLGARPGKYIDKLQSLGVNVLETSDMEMVSTLVPNVDVIIFAWHYSYYSCAPLRKIYPDAITIADTVDVHWVREERSIGHHGDLTREKVEENKRQELEVYRNVDQIWTVTEVDTAAVRSEIPGVGITLVSNIHEPEIHEYKEKKEPNILFFGGYQHYPNIAAAKIVAREIFPKIQDQIPNASLFIAGSNAPEEIIALAEIEGVEFLGFIEEKDVPALYNRMALTIVPLLSGAGIKGKICQAISYRVPVITNAIGNEGIGLIHEEEGLLSEDFYEMADLAVHLLQGDYNIGEMTSKAQVKIARIVGPDIVRKNMIRSISPPVSICIVTWNRKELLEKCIDSIFKYTRYPEYRILVHSNACSDGTREYLEKLSEVYSNVIPIFSDDNEVFVIPNNRMMMMYPEDDVVLLNNDTEVTEGWLVNLWRAAYSTKKIGIAGSKILYPDGRLQEFGSELYPDGTGRNIGKYDDPDKPDYQGVHKVGYVSGCAMYIKRSTIEKIGVFDESFHPCYCEDSDFCYTAWEQGLETVVTSDSVISHHEGATSGTDTTSGFKAYQEVNMKRFLEKHSKFLYKTEMKIQNSKVRMVKDVDFISQIQESIFSNSGRLSETLLEGSQMNGIDLNIPHFTSISSFELFQDYREKMIEVYKKREEIERRIYEGQSKDFDLWGFNPLINKNVPYRIQIKKNSKELNNTKPNFRETLICPITQTNSRLRASGLLIENFLSQRKQQKNIAYFTEQTTPFYKLYFDRFTNLVGSEFLGNNIEPGSIKGGLRHEDITKLSFDDLSFDLVVSLEVLEHVPEYYKGLKEVYRCLKPDGMFLISVPFVVHSTSTITRARVNNGEIEYLLPPEFHANLVNTNGRILCFYHFGWDLLRDLKEIGFRSVSLEFIWNLRLGILGKDIFIIKAFK